MKSNLVTEGEFAGWRCWREDAFEQAAGPFYYRDDEQGPVAAFRAEAKHMNLGASVHGGCLMSFADFALFAIAKDEIGEDGFAVFDNRDGQARHFELFHEERRAAIQFFGVDFGGRLSRGFLRSSWARKG